MANRGDHVTQSVSDLPQYMVVERFHKNCKDKIYERFNTQGRMLPEGLHYIDSWLSTDSNLCFQLMATNNVHLFEEWFQHWNDLTDFEVHPIGSKPTKSTQSSS